MSRGSQTAGGSGKPSPKARAVWLFVWVGLVGVHALTHGNSPWFDAYCAGVAFVAIALMLRERRRAK
jgi:hypothetical protein